MSWRDPVETCVLCIIPPDCSNVIENIGVVTKNNIRKAGIFESVGVARARGDRRQAQSVSSEPVSKNRKFPASWENTRKFIDFGP
jgi:hypothetical protein